MGGLKELYKNEPEHANVLKVENRGETKGLDLSDNVLKSIFYLLIFGLVLATLIFLVEMVMPEIVFCVWKWGCVHLLRLYCKEFN